MGSLTETVLINEAIELRDAFLIEQERVARDKILTALARQREFNREDYPSAANWLELPKVSLKQTAQGNRNGSRVKPHEPSGDAWDCARCLQSLRALPRLWAGRARPVLLPFQNSLPPYTSWFPVYKNFSINTPAETYLPFFGNEAKDLELAEKALGMMEKEERKNSAFDLPSDGEVDEKSGFFIPQGALDDMFLVDEFDKIRARAAQRHAILQVVTKYGDGVIVLNSMRKALNLPTISNVMATFAIAQKRAVEQREHLNSLQCSKQKGRQIMRAITDPECRFQSSNAAIIENVLKLFCHVCHDFGCDLHEEYRPIPQQPIPDESLKARLSDIAFRTTKACSQRCYMLKQWDQLPIDSRENEPWNDEENLLLREGLFLYNMDPCSISIIIGSRGCREVNRMLDSPIAKRWIKDASDTQKQHARVQRQFTSMIASEHSSGHANRYNCDGADEMSAIKAKKLKKTRQSANNNNNNCRKKGRTNDLVQIRRPRKSSVTLDDSTEDLGHWACQPCNHGGRCSMENCECVRNGRLCEPFCACNGERYTFSERRNEIVAKGDRCSNRASFCECRDGNCDPLECYCYVELGKTCDPEQCACDSKVGPWEVSLSDRRCKNSELFGHKRTFVGRSKESGFGLFAGERFDKGDLVGTYIGALLPAEIVDGSCAVGDAIGKMYTFDVRNVTIDGTTLGSKVRFINHHEEWESPNCKSSEVQMQGHWYQRLTTLRVVEPGEEFFFDYRIVDPSGREDCTYALPSWLKERRKREGLAVTTRESQ